jgi:hypothetical protein
MSIEGPKFNKDGRIEGDMSVEDLNIRIKEIEERLKIADNKKAEELHRELEEINSIFKARQKEVRKRLYEASQRWEEDKNFEKIKKEEDEIITEASNEIVGDSIEQEEKQESIPTSEDIQSVFEELLEGKEYETRRKLEDEQGLYLWEIEISEEDGHTEYLYMRKGRYEEGGQASDTAIHIAFFDEDDFPISGSSVAKYMEGEWKLTP